MSLTFGPIPSRRLGHSLGVNNIPPKACSFACVYCQVGHTTHMRMDRQVFYPPEEIYDAVFNKIARLCESDEPVDYISFVPDGEPTLDINLGREIEMLKPLGYKIAVITNASLIWRDDVKRELMAADWVSLKIDSLDDKEWHQVDRPHKKLSLETIKHGMIEFAGKYPGKLVTETMLVQGMNDSVKHAETLGLFLQELNPSQAFILVPTRPPVESAVKAPDEKTLNRFYLTVKKKFAHVEYQIRYEGNEYGHSAGVEEDILAITAVHPMRREAVEKFLKKTKSDWAHVQRLLDKGLLIETNYGGHTFYVRKLSAGNS